MSNTTTSPAVTLKEIVSGQTMYFYNQIIICTELPTVGRQKVLYVVIATGETTGSSYVYTDDWVSIGGGGGVTSHPELSSKNAEDDYLHITATEKASFTAKQDALTAVTITISVADWSGGLEATKAAAGVTATSYQDYYFNDTTRQEIIASNFRPTAQGVNTVTFTADSTPTADITLTITIKEI